MPRNSNQTVFIDSHVHIYPSYCVEKFFDSALKNFSDLAHSKNIDNFIGVLLLAETSNDHWFADKMHRLDTGIRYSKDNALKWKFSGLKDESCTLQVMHTDGAKLMVIAGRQIITREGIEVLALITDKYIHDGLSLNDTILTINELGGLPVIPWGVGKWLGSRGRIVQAYIANNRDQFFFLGDNGGRPVFWRDIIHFKLARDFGIGILPGSDPLPLASEEMSVARFGCILESHISEIQPAKDLKKIFMTKDVYIQPYGNLESVARFIINQVKLRLPK